MRYLLLLLLLLPVNANADYLFSRALTTSSTFGIPTGTKIQKDSVTTPSPGDLYYMTDGDGTDDCTVGGGANKNICVWNGSAWVPLGAGFTITLPATHAETVKSALQPDQNAFNAHMNDKYPDPPYDGDLIKTGGNWDLDNMLWWDTGTTTTSTSTSTSTSTTTTSTSTSTSSTSTSTSTSTTSTSTSTTTTVAGTTTTSTSSTSSTSTTTTSTTTTTTVTPLASWHNFGWDYSYLADDCAADACIGDGSGPDVENWDDGQSGDVDLIQDTAGDAPHYSATSGPNSQPGITCDGTDDFMVASIGNHAQPTTFIVIYTSSANNASEQLIDSDHATNRNIIFAASDGELAVNGGAALTNTGIDFGPATHVVTVYFNGASSVVEVDGVEAESGDAGSNAIEDMTLCSKYDDTNHMAVSVSAIGIFSGDARADGDWEALQSYVNTKWSLDIEP